MFYARTYCWKLCVQSTLCARIQCLKWRLKDMFCARIHCWKWCAQKKWGPCFPPALGQILPPPGQPAAPLSPPIQPELTLRCSPHFFLAIPRLLWWEARTGSDVWQKFQKIFGAFMGHFYFVCTGPAMSNNIHIWIFLF